MSTLGLDDDSPSEPQNRLRLSLGMMVQIVVYVIVLALAYSAIDKRVTVLESKYDRIAQDLQEIRADVKILIQRRP